MEPQDRRLSVVLCSYNRAERVLRTIHAVIGQLTNVDELVIVDDGSTDQTPNLLKSISDDRVVIVHRENGGLCRARNTGLSRARGRWVTFLDDDDVPADGWVASLASKADDDTQAVFSVGARFVDTTGNELGRVFPVDLGPAFKGAVALYFPGTFSVRRDVAVAAGGYAEGLEASHQFEFFLRVTQVALERGLAVSHESLARIDVERRPAKERPLFHPRLLFDANRWVLARHAVALGADRKLMADFHAVVGVNAARLGEWGAARRFLVRSVAAEPWAIRRFGRLCLSSLPLVGRKVWGGTRTWATHNHAALGIPSQIHANGRVDGHEFFLPWRYAENSVRSSDVEGYPYWAAGTESSDVRNQDPVYRVARRLVRRRGWTPVVDVGCGTGHKLVTHVGRVTDDFVGADQGSAITIARRTFPMHRWIEGDVGSAELWDALAAEHPRLVLCIDVIEHVADPVSLLRRLRALIGERGRLLLSTPNRAILENSSDRGPPLNQRHVREWSRDELELLLLSTGFKIERLWQLLPRRYSATRTELNRTAYRALHFRAVPDRRSCMAFLLKVADG